MKKNVRMILILFCITSLLSGCALLPFSDDNPFAKQGGKKGEKEVAKIVRAKNPKSRKIRTKNRRKKINKKKIKRRKTRKQKKRKR